LGVWARRVLSGALPGECRTAPDGRVVGLVRRWAPQVRWVRRCGGTGPPRGLLGPSAMRRVDASVPSGALRSGARRNRTKPPRTGPCAPVRRIALRRDPLRRASLGRVPRLAAAARVGRIRFGRIPRPVRCWDASHCPSLHFDPPDYAPSPLDGPGCAASLCAPSLCAASPPGPSLCPASLCAASHACDPLELEHGSESAKSRVCNRGRRVPSSQVRCLDH